VSVRKGSDCVSRWHFDQEYGWLSRSGEPSTLRDEHNDNEQETANYVFLSLSPEARIPRRLRRQQHHTAALL
jgi:hypothetical protein